MTQPCYTCGRASDIACPACRKLVCARHLVGGASALDVSFRVGYQANKEHRQILTDLLCDYCPDTRAANEYISLMAEEGAVGPVCQDCWVTRFQTLQRNVVVPPRPAPSPQYERALEQLRALPVVNGSVPSRQASAVLTAAGVEPDWEYREYVEYRKPFWRRESKTISKRGWGLKSEWQQQFRHGDSTIVRVVVEGLTVDGVHTGRSSAGAPVDPKSVSRASVLSLLDRVHDGDPDPVMRWKDLRQAVPLELQWALLGLAEHD